MDSSERFSKLLAEFDSNPDFVLDDVLTDLTERIDALMAEKGITRTELARRMGVTPPVITRLLSGTENTTLKTLLRVAFALDTVLDVELGKPEAIAARREARAEQRKPERAVRMQIRGTFNVPRESRPRTRTCPAAPSFRLVVNGGIPRVRSHAA